MRVRRKMQICAAACALALCLTACSGGAASSAAAGSDAAASTSASEDGLNVEKNLFSVTLTYPASMVDEGTTQDSLNDEIKGIDGIKSATLNEDGSVTYIMTKAYHKQIVDDMAQTIDESMAEMVGSEDYPNFTNVEANEDYTVFTVTTKSKALSLDESLSLLQFYTEGAFYSVVSGNDADSIHVDFVNADTGEVIDGGTQSLKD